MSEKSKFSWLFKNLILQCVVFYLYSITANAQIVQSADLSNIQPVSYSELNQNTLQFEKASTNFYKNDSIFSFRSQKGFFPSLLKDFEEQMTVPFRLKSKQLLMTGIAIGTTVALIQLDNDIDEWARVQKQKHNWVNKSSPIVTNFGGKLGIYSVLTAGVLSAACKNEKGVQTTLLATQAMITSGIWVNLIKILTGRERPLADYAFSKSEGGRWYGPLAVWDQDLAIRKPVSAFDSFPSGHTATAFSIATVIATQCSDKKAIPVICYSAATLVGISRLTEHEHWASDVFVGGIMGYLCGKQVVNHYNKIHQNTAKSMSSKFGYKSEFTFIQGGNQIGFSLKW
jgi:hypothetical protein